MLTNMQYEDHRRIMTAPYGANGARQSSGNHKRSDVKTPSSVNVEHPINSKSFDVGSSGMPAKIPSINRQFRPPA